MAATPPLHIGEADASFTKQKYCDILVPKVGAFRMRNDMDFEQYSASFAEFYRAFAPETYGESMGRAAVQAVYLYDDLADDEKAAAIEWFLELFASENAYWGLQYFDVIDKMNDARFLPLLEIYDRQLKTRRHFHTERKRCQATMRLLKRL